MRLCQKNKKYQETVVVHNSYLFGHIYIYTYIYITMVIIYVQSLSVEFPDLLLNQINLTRQLYELKKWLWVLHATVSLLLCVLKHVMVNMINSKVLYYTRNNDEKSLESMAGPSSC